MIKRILPILLFGGLALTSCNDDDEDGNNPGPQLTIPSEYLAPNYDANVVTENTVMNEFADMVAALNAAEANAQGGTTIESISYPINLEAVTLPRYSTLVDEWLTELVNAANSPTPFQNPGSAGQPIPGEQGGLLGTRLLDENGLELEQMIEKGSFGAALYHHALKILSADTISASDIDRLVEIHGTEVSFDPASTNAAALYAARRSNHDAQTGFYYDIRTNLITAKSAIEGGSAFNDIRDEAFNDYLLNWEKSNFATVIFYCEATKNLLQEASQLSGEEREIKLGDALHAYSEGVGFTHGFRGLSQKQITDEEIDQILADLLAPENETPESYRFLNEVSLIANLDKIQNDIQSIYGFTNEEVSGFHVNNNP
ncbi:hypothetical protein O3Q51_02710 [Cryomorphaceae bacterium 1068]|nr:hypothetical protein [Cryomorphaceae bacterium 1068]